MKPTSLAVTSKMRGSRKKGQKVDAEIGLRVDDPVIDRDAAILAILRHTVRRNIAAPDGRRPPQERPTLYRWYRGQGFPLRQPSGHRLPQWRDLSAWMRAQIGTLVLSETGWMPFKVHVHDDLWDQWLREERGLRDELRNSIARHLKRRFGPAAPPFFFVLEDRTTTGEQTRPHAHGSIAVAEAHLPEFGPGSRKLLQLSEHEGIAVARVEAGRLLIKDALNGAAGSQRRRIAATTGLDQARNVWTRKKPYHPLFNHQYVDYAFRNTNRVSRTLGDNRFAMTNPLRGEANRLWNLIKHGEEALEQWQA